MDIDPIKHGARYSILVTSLGLMGAGTGFETIAVITAGLGMNTIDTFFLAQ